MRAIKYDFDIKDIVVAKAGNFEIATVDNQNIALISVSQVCRITKPEVGAQIGTYIINRQNRNIGAILGRAVRMAENDGAKNVSVNITDDQLLFRGYYED